ncbi:MAG: biotin/lipoyl-binding protein, partial [Gallionella sp.]
MTLSRKKNSSLLKRYLPWLIAVILLLSVVWYYTRPKPIEVQFVTVERGTVEATISNTRAGTVKACRRAKLSAPAGGQISKMRVIKGERVKRDQVLLELWNDDMQAQKQLAEDQLATTISQSKEACTIAETALSDAERAQKLREQGFISQEALERTLSTATARQASCESSRSAINQSKSR